MKTRLSLLFVLIACSYSTFAQSPEGFNYQAVIRDAANNILSNQAVGMQLALLQGTPAGTVVYTEAHTATTGTYGLVALTIGTGATSDVFANIDWANGPYFLEIAADVTGGTSYSVLGTQQLMSVPYALYAKSSGSTTDTTEITDTDNDTKIQLEESGDEDVIRFDVAGTEQMNLNTSSLTVKVPTTIYKGQRNALTLRTTNNALETGISFRNAGTSYSWSIFREPVSGNEGQGSLVFSGGVSSNDPANLNERMRISNTGNVGINTNAPDEKLHIVGNIKMVDGNQSLGKVLTSDADGKATWQTNSSGIQTLIADTDNDTKIQVEESSDEDMIRFDVAGSEAMTIDDNSNVRIGDTAPFQEKLNVDGNILINGTGSGIVHANNTRNYLKFHNGFGTELSAESILNFRLGINDVAIFQPGNIALKDNVRIEGTLNINNTYTLPSTDGTANQVLQTDGSGNVSWGTSSGYEIIKVTLEINLPNVPGNDVVYVNVSGVTGAQVGATVSISPAGDFPGSLYIGNVRITSNNTIRLQILNEGSSSQNIGLMDYFITVIQ